MRSRAALLAATALLGAGSLAACGDDDEESGSEETSAEAPAEDATSVDLTATEYEFDLSATPTAETEEVTFDNQGKEFHVMIFARINEGFTLDEAVKLEGEKGSATIVAEAEAAPGESKTVKVKDPAEPGDYAMLCPIPSPDGPHYELGQLEEFSIE
jgi:plastocyanin